MRLKKMRRLSTGDISKESKKKTSKQKSEEAIPVVPPSPDIEETRSRTKSLDNIVSKGFFKSPRFLRKKKTEEGISNANLVFSTYAGKYEPLATLDRKRVRERSFEDEKSNQEKVDGDRMLHGTELATAMHELIANNRMEDVKEEDIDALKELLDDVTGSGIAYTVHPHSETPTNSPNPSPCPDILLCQQNNGGAIGGFKNSLFKHDEVGEFSRSESRSLEVVPEIETEELYAEPLTSAREQEMNENLIEFQRNIFRQIQQNTKDVKGGRQLLDHNGNIVDEKKCVRFKGSSDSLLTEVDCFTTESVSEDAERMFGVVDKTRMVEYQTTGYVSPEKQKMLQNAAHKTNLAQERKLSAVIKHSPPPINLEVLIEQKIQASEERREAKKFLEEANGGTKATVSVSVENFEDNGKCAITKVCESVEFVDFSKILIDGIIWDAKEILKDKKRGENEKEVTSSEHVTALYKMPQSESNIVTTKERVSEDAIETCRVKIEETAADCLDGLFNGDELNFGTDCETFSKEESVIGHTVTDQESKSVDTFDTLLRESPSTDFNNKNFAYSTDDHKPHNKRSININSTWVITDCEKEEGIYDPIQDCIYTPSCYNFNQKIAQDISKRDANLLKLLDNDSVPRYKVKREKGSKDVVKSAFPEEVKLKQDPKTTVYQVEFKPIVENTNEQVESEAKRKVIETEVSSVNCSLELSQLSDLQNDYLSNETLEKDTRISKPVEQKKMEESIRRLEKCIRVERASENLSSKENLLTITDEPCKEQIHVVTSTPVEGTVESNFSTVSEVNACIDEYASKTAEEILYPTKKLATNCQTKVENIEITEESSMEKSENINENEVKGAEDNIQIDDGENLKEDPGEFQCPMIKRYDYHDNEIETSKENLPHPESRSAPASLIKSVEVEKEFLDPVTVNEISCLSVEESVKNCAAIQEKSVIVPPKNVIVPPKNVIVPPKSVIVPPKNVITQPKKEKRHFEQAQIKNELADNGTVRIEKHCAELDKESVIDNEISQNKKPFNRLTEPGKEPAQDETPFNRLTEPCKEPAQDETPFNRLTEPGKEPAQDETPFNRLTEPGKEPTQDETPFNRLTEPGKEPAHDETPFSRLTEPGKEPAQNETSFNRLIEPGKESAHEETPFNRLTEPGKEPAQDKTPFNQLTEPGKEPAQDETPFSRLTEPGKEPAHDETPFSRLTELGKEPAQNVTPFSRLTEPGKEPAQDETPFNRFPDSIKESKFDSSCKEIIPINDESLGACALDNEKTSVSRKEMLIQQLLWRMVKQKEHKDEKKIHSNSKSMDSSSLKLRENIMKKLLKKKTPECVDEKERMEDDAKYENEEARKVSRIAYIMLKSCQFDEEETLSRNIGLNKTDTKQRKIPLQPFRSILQKQAPVVDERFDRNKRNKTQTSWLSSQKSALRPLAGKSSVQEKGLTTNQQKDVKTIGNHDKEPQRKTPSSNDKMKTFVKAKSLSNIEVAPRKKNYGIYSRLKNVNELKLTQENGKEKMSKDDTILEENRPSIENTNLFLKHGGNRNENSVTVVKGYQTETLFTSVKKHDTDYVIIAADSSKQRKTYEPESDTLSVQLTTKKVPSNVTVELRSSGGLTKCRNKEENQENNALTINVNTYQSYVSLYEVLPRSANFDGFTIHAGAP